MMKNDFLGDEVSRLGFGAMRLPVIDGDASAIDAAQVDAMVDAAVRAGVNYFDTAYPYHGGHSELEMGRSLARYPRESFFLTTYNDMQFETSFTVSMQMDAVPAGQRAQDCLACGACTRMCPQGIDIPDTLAKLAATLEKMPKWADLCRERAEAAAKLRG